MNYYHGLLGKIDVLSWQDYLSLGIQRDEYHTCKKEGRYYATLDCKRWSRSSAMVLYFTTISGEKIVACVWPFCDEKSRYLRMNIIPVGTKLVLSFKKGKRNKDNAYLKEARITNSILWLDFKE